MGCLEKMAKGFNMEVKSYDKFSNYRGEKDLYEVLQSDIVSLHIPLPGNEAFFNLELLEKMKPSACLINTSRMGILNKKDFLFSLKQGIIYKAAIDFTDDDEILEHSKTSDNLILTNHIGGRTYEDSEAVESFIIKQIENYV